LHRVLGRLESWTIVTRLWRKALDSLLPRPRWLRPGGTAFEGALPSEIAVDLSERGYHAGLQMPAHLVEELRQHAMTAPCWRKPGDPERFLIAEVENGRSPLGRPVAVADVDADACPATALIAGDPVLVDAVRRHLGYHPKSVVARLFWSPRSVLPDHERRWNGQTIDYHYDNERWNAVYLFFYLSDTDRRSGAHVLIAGSHKSKPLSIKLGSTHQPEQVVLERYGADKVVVLEGAAGFGFFEDPACFHKVLPPLKADRLVLQLRYT
jgi:hypothetical protein